MSDNTMESIAPGCGCSACMSAANQSAGSADNNSYNGTIEGTEGNAGSLMQSSTWSTNNLQYKFITDTPTYYAAGDKEQNNFTAFNTQMQNATIRILDELESFTNLTFTQTTTEDAYGVLTFGQATREAGVGGHAYYPHSHSKGGDVWINNVHAYNQTPVEGNYAFYTLLHEIGHALGLQHSFDVYTGIEETSRFSVMAYDTSPFVSESFMLYDIKALQDTYGANTTHNLGDDTYVLKSGAGYTIWDAGGNDTFDASHINTDVVLDLTEGGFSSVGDTNNIAIAFGVTIENATGGSGDDILGGNDADNILIGNAGNDTFYDSEGNDTMDGGTGNDTAILSYNLADYLIQITNVTTISLQNLITSAITTLIDIEDFVFNDVTHTFNELDTMFGMNLILGNNNNNPLDGTDDDDRVNGMDGTDVIYAGLGNDILNGDGGWDKLWAGAGNDTLNGGTGDDYLWGEDGDDVLYGNEGDDELWGNDGADTLYGGDGNDDLMGGLGNDRLEGGAGNDYIKGEYGQNTIYGDAGDDNIAAGRGNDTVYGGADNDTLYGQGGDDILYGDAGNDLLHGGGGNDTLNGGDGNDVIAGGSGNDTINGGTGTNMLRGNSGNDIFVIETTSTLNTTIYDFSSVDDRLDITDLLQNYDSLTDDINDFFRIVRGGTNGKMIEFDSDGLVNGVNFVGVAQIRGIANKQADALDADGLLIY